VIAAPHDGERSAPAKLTAAALDRARRWALDELVRLVEIPSPSGEEEAIVAYLERRAAELDLPARRAVVTPGWDNLIVGGALRPDLAIIAHLDTVRPTWAWSGKAEVRGHEVWGLGAVDDKGGVVAALLALMLARDAGVPVDDLPVCVGLTVDEEEGGSGSIALAKSLRPRHTVALESTGFDIAAAEAGVVEVVLVVHGKSAHGSVPEQGDNAVVKAARLVVALDSLPFLARSHPLLASAVVVQQMHGGSDLHAVPGEAEVHIDTRVAPGLRAREVLREVQNLARGYDADVRVIEVADPWEAPPGSTFVPAVRRAVKETLDREPQLFAFPAWTDAHNMVELGGSEAVVFGPGPQHSSAHRPEDHIDVYDVVDCALVLRRLICDVWRAGQTAGRGP
jgi:acetylornithine deacetylase/succinyl-diaminopimelate desuccinylase-like protein